MLWILRRVYIYWGCVGVWGFSTKPLKFWRNFFSTKPVKGGGAGFCTMGVNHFFARSLLKMFSARSLSKIMGGFFWHDGCQWCSCTMGAKKERLWMFSMIKFLLRGVRIKTMHLKSSVIFDWRCRIIKCCWKIGFCCTFDVVQLVIKF